jgi:hypothetical protein
MRKSLNYFALLACGLCILATLPFFYVVPRALDPQGGQMAAVLLRCCRLLRMEMACWYQGMKRFATI